MLSFIKEGWNFNMISWKLARVYKSLAAALILGTFLPAGIALAAEETSAAPAETAEAADSEVVTLAEETNKESSTDFELLDYFVTAERIPTSRWAV